MHVCVFMRAYVLYVRVYVVYVCVYCVCVYVLYVCVCTVCMCVRAGLPRPSVSDGGQLPAAAYTALTLPLPVPHYTALRAVGEEWDFELARSPHLFPTITTLCAPVNTESAAGQSQSGGEGEGPSNATQVGEIRPSLIQGEYENRKTIIHSL